MRSIQKKLFKVIDTGKGFDRRIFLVDENNKKLSYWNDIPFRFDDSQSNVINSVIEIPRYTLMKLELQKDEEYHPIAYEIRQNLYDKSKTESQYWYTFGLFNYAFVPQTWENSLVPHKEIDNLLGDDDPIDLIEISDKSFAPGTIVPTKIFGIFALIDQGEVDWKIVGLNKEEADAKKIHTLDDLNREFPCRLDAIKRWFKYYKNFEGLASNWIYFDDKILDVDRTLEVLSESHNHWKELRNIQKDKNKPLDEVQRKLLEKFKKYKF